MTPVVSVLMPVYNGAAFLDEALDSVLGQTLSDLELIVVNDGSTDQTATILAARSDARLVVLSQDNAGMAASLNRALGQARGRYVARMDADDRSLPTRLARQVARLDSRPGIDILGSSYRRIDERGLPIDVVAALVPSSAVLRDLYLRSPFGHGTVMIRKEVLDRLGGYDGAWWPADDYDLWRRLLVSSRGENLPEVLYEYRLHGDNSSVPAQDAMAERIRDELWARSGPPALTTRGLVVEAVQHLRGTGDVRRILLSTYLSRQLAVVAEAVRRGRWDVVRRLRPAVPVALSRGPRQAVRPILRKISPKRCR